MRVLKYFGKHKVLILFLLICLVSSSVFSKDKSKEILVFAGAGMRLPLNEIGTIFEKKYGVKVVYDFAGSGRLGNKILVGQIPDIFIPGSDKWAKILKEKGYIRNYAPIARHMPVIITPEGNSNVTSLRDFINPDYRVVLADVKAAALGSISAEIFKKAKLDESMMHVRARGVTVKQLVLWIEGNNADASIVWKADAVQSGKVRVVPISAEYNVTNIIPICQMKEDEAAAVQFVKYVSGTEGKKIFKRHGFKVVD